MTAALLLAAWEVEKLEEIYKLVDFRFVMAVNSIRELERLIKRRLT